MNPAEGKRNQNEHRKQSVKSAKASINTQTQTQTINESDQTEGPSSAQPLKTGPHPQYRRKSSGRSGKSKGKDRDVNELETKQKSSVPNKSDNFELENVQDKSSGPGPEPESEDTANTPTPKPQANAKQKQRKFSASSASGDPKNKVNEGNKNKQRHSSIPNQQTQNPTETEAKPKVVPKRRTSIKNDDVKVKANNDVQNDTEEVKDSSKTSGGNNEQFHQRRKLSANRKNNAKIHPHHDPDSRNQNKQDPNIPIPNPNPIPTTTISVSKNSETNMEKNNLENTDEKVKTESENQRSGSRPVLSPRLVQYKLNSELEFLEQKQQYNKKPEISSQTNLLQSPYVGTGLEYLEDTNEVNIFLRTEPLAFKTPEMVVSSFDVLNDKGETIFFMAEIKCKCFLCAKWSHFIGIYSVLGEYVMSVVKRNQGSCNSHSSRYKDLEEMQPYFLADGCVHSACLQLSCNQGRVESSSSAKLQNGGRPEAAYHVRLTNGQFVGHFKENKSVNENRNPYKFSLFDADFSIVYQVQEIKPLVKGEIIQGNPFQEALYPYMQIYHDHRPFGRIYSGADLHKFGIRTGPEHCFHADFPRNTPPKNKALILGLVAISHCETLSVEENVCLNCCVACSRVKCVIC